MKMEQSFDVAAPLERVWAALIDVEYVAPCLPGAAITERDDDGAYHGTFTVKLGPTTASYNGVLHIGEIDEAGHRATLHARGTDKRGQGGASATIVNTISESADGRTHVEAVTDFTITGRLARFGRGGMIEDISNRLLRNFAECLSSKLLADEAGGGEATAAGAPAGEVAGEPTPSEVGMAAAGAIAPGGAAPEAAAAGMGAAAPSMAAAAAGSAAPEAAAATAGSAAPEAAAAAAQAAGARSDPSAGSSAAARSGAGPTGAAPRRTAVQQQQQAPPVQGFSLFLKVLWDRLRRALASLWQRFRARG